MAAMAAPSAASLRPGDAADTAGGAPAVPADRRGAHAERQARLAARMAKLTPAQRAALERRTQGEAATPDPASAAPVKESPRSPILVYRRRY